MKKIRLAAAHSPRDSASPYTAHHLYSVSLGNRRTVMFASERAALAFAAATDRWINGHLAACNFLLIECFTGYRNAWAVLDQSAVRQVDERCRELVHDAWASMDRALFATGPNNWHFAWQHLQAAITSVRDLAVLLEEFYARRSSPVARQRMQLMLARANAILDDFAAYGAEVKGAHSVRTL